MTLRIICLLMFLFSVESAFALESQFTTLGVLNTLKLYDSGGSNSLNMTQTTLSSGSYGIAWPAAQGAAGSCPTNDGSGNLTWTVPAGTGIASFGTFGSTPSAQGASIAGTVATLQPADATHPGGISTTTQTIPGAKTFAAAMSGGEATFTNPDDALAHSVNFCGEGATVGGNFCWTNYVSPSGVYSLYNIGENVYAQTSYINGFTMFGQPLSSPVDTVSFRAQASETNIPDLGIILQLGQTANMLEFYESDAATLLAHVDVTGKFFVPNIQNAGAVSGCLQADSSGNVSSTGTTCKSGTVTAVSVASANGFAGSSSGGATPALTISTSINSPVLAGNGTAISAATLTSADFWVGNGSNAPAAVAMSGDATLANTGAVTLATVNASPGTTAISSVTTNGKGLVTANSAATTTGSGSVVLATSPTLVTPVLGTPSSGTLTSCTGLPLTTGVTGVLPTAKVGLGYTANAQSGTTYTFVLSDGVNAGGNTLVSSTSGSATTFTVPPNSSVAYAVGDSIQLEQDGAGALTIAAGAGVTIHSISSGLTLSAEYATAVLIKKATNTWLLAGSLGP